MNIRSDYGSSHGRELKVFRLLAYARRIIIYRVCGLVLLFTVIRFVSVLGFIVVLFAIPQKSHAAWSLNTPDKQFGPLWAGDSIVWNDDRLGSVDVFMRDSHGVISPLITGDGDQKVVAASATIVVVSDSDSSSPHLYVYNLASHAIHPLGLLGNATQFAAYQNEAAWSDGHAVWWWDGSVISSRLLDNTGVSLGNGGVMIKQTDAVIVWSLGADQSTTCIACQAIMSLQSGFAALDDVGTVTLWPSGQVVAQGVDQLLSNGTVLAYRQNGTRYVYRDGQSILTPLIIDGSFGLGGFVWSDGQDITLMQDPAPSVSVGSCGIEPNSATCIGGGSGWRVVAHITKPDKTIATTSYLIQNDLWSGSLLAADAVDGSYAVTLTAESALGQKSAAVVAGPIVLDHRPPIITDQTIQVEQDSARIHIQTDELANYTLHLSDGDQTLDRSSSRLTFSHTITVNDLDPGRGYNMDASLRDKTHNSRSVIQHFETPSLLSPQYHRSLTIEAGVSGVWDGVVVAPPGIIDDKQMAMRLYAPGMSYDGRIMRLNWTILAPPGGLSIGNWVRIKGTVNSVGDTILLYRPASLALVDSIHGPPHPLIIDPNNSHMVADQWVNVYGTLASVTKTGWKIMVGDSTVPIHWEHDIPLGFARGDKVRISGFTYLSTSEVVTLAATSAELVSAVQAQLTLPDQSVVSVTQPQIKLAAIMEASAHTPVVAVSLGDQVVTSREITMQETETSDRNENLWYSIVLYGITIFITSHFFFRSRVKPTRY